MKQPIKHIKRLDGRIEWTCEHGIGHTVFSLDDHYIHGCDGCCSGWLELYKRGKRIK